MMSLGEYALKAVDWSQVSVPGGGTGESLSLALAALLASRDSADAERAWWGIENVAFSQGTIYEAAEPTVGVMLAALADERPPVVNFGLSKFSSLF